MAKRMKTSKRFKIYKATRRKLSEAYPKAFPWKGRRIPLKIGIIKDIAEDDLTDIPNGELRVFLSIWTSSSAYLESISKNMERVCLKGDPCGRVSKENADEAKKRLSVRRKQSCQIN